ncbi:MAG TPA: insulinase family protein, partial [Stenomitos sp.]
MAAQSTSITTRVVYQLACLLGICSLCLGMSLTSTLLWASPVLSAPNRITAVAMMDTLTRGVEKTVLDNGLTVLTKEIHTAPVVSVQVWYRVGARNEAVGLNGISHQLEHLLFKGTQSRPIQFGRLF